MKNGDAQSDKLLIKGCTESNNVRVSIHVFKETVKRDFLTLVFFIKRIILVSMDILKIDFEFCGTFMDLFVHET
jgi:hypothetical protein